MCMSVQQHFRTEISPEPLETLPPEDDFTLTAWLSENIACKYLAATNTTDGTVCRTVAASCLDFKHLGLGNRCIVRDCADIADLPPLW